MTRDDRKFPFLMGFVDGFLTALTLAAGRLFDKTSTADLSLAIRVAIASLVSSGFVFFVARYSELRRELMEAERELSLGHSGMLASTALGKKVRKSAIIDASISGVSSFIGAMFPLVFAAFDPFLPWLTLTFSMLILAIFGFFLGKSVGKQPLIWVAALMLGGAFVIWVGIILHLT